jgi:hypothetical protein
MRTNIQIFKDGFLRFVIWGISFALIYWLATDNLWLCAFIASAITSAQFAISVKEVGELLLPMTQSNDYNINNLYSKTEALEEEVSDLKEVIADLKRRLAVLE